ncbi:hypothetical protein ES703_57873 [subsurface metagenome]
MCAFKLLLDKCDNNSQGSATYKQTVLSKLRSIFISEAVSQVFAYFCLDGASTAWVLQCELNMPEATVYRALKRLRTIGVLVPTLKVSKPKRSKGGPRPTVWALEDALHDDVAEALGLHYQLLPPPEKRGYNIHTPRRKAK